MSPRLRLLILVVFCFALPPMPSIAHDGPAVLTIVGAIEKTNRGPLDPFRDALLARLVDPFEKAYRVTADDLAAMPQQIVTARYQDWPGDPHVFRGPLVGDLLALVKARGTKVTVMGIDGYSAQYERAVLEKAGFILALQMDGEPLDLGGFGPVWLMVSPDAEPAVPDGKPTDSGLVWSAFYLLVE